MDILHDILRRIMTNYIEITHPQSKPMYVSFDLQPSKKTEVVKYLNNDFYINTIFKKKIQKNIVPENIDTTCYMMNFFPFKPIIFVKDHDDQTNDADLINTMLTIICVYIKTFFGKYEKKPINRSMILPDGTDEITDILPNSCFIFYLNRLTREVHIDYSGEKTMDLLAHDLSGLTTGGYTAGNLAYMIVTKRTGICKLLIHELCHFCVLEGKCSYRRMETPNFFKNTNIDDGKDNDAMFESITELISVIFNCMFGALQESPELSERQVTQKFDELMRIEYNYSTNLTLNYFRWYGYDTVEKIKLFYHNPDNVVGNKIYDYTTFMYIAGRDYCFKFLSHILPCFEKMNFDEIVPKLPIFDSQHVDEYIDMIKQHKLVVSNIFNYSQFNVIKLLRPIISNNSIDTYLFANRLLPKILTKIHFLNKSYEKKYLQSLNDVMDDPTIFIQNKITYGPKWKNTTSVQQYYLFPKVLDTNGDNIDIVYDDDDIVQNAPIEQLLAFANSFDIREHILSPKQLVGGKYKKYKLKQLKCK